MENVNRWYYTKDQLATTPSRKCDIDQPKELSYRQQAANFIQDMGQRLQLSQLCINTAIVYMHRFYVYHSFTEVHRNNLSISALFLAAKVEEQPRKLEHVIKIAHVCLHKDAPALDVRSEAYAEKAQEVVFHENILLQTLGFVLAIEHPHTYVVKVCQLVKASKDLAQSSYLMATTSLHMTTMCIQYKPTVVACVCIHLACKWSSYLIEPCSQGREWFYYVDRTVTLELLERLTQEFIAILETSPHRFKKKFGGKDTVGYHNPKAIIENAAKEAKEASASEKKNGLKREEPSPGPSTSLSFDFCPDFEDKQHLKFDKVPEFEHSSVKKVPEMPVVKNKVVENNVAHCSKRSSDSDPTIEASPHRLKKKIGGKETAVHHNPKPTIENPAKEAKEASAYEKKNGHSIKKEEPHHAPSIKKEEPSPGFSIKREDPSPGFSIKKEEPNPGFSNKREEPSPRFSIKKDEPSPRFSIKKEEPSPVLAVKKEEPSPALANKKEEPSPGVSSSMPFDFLSNYEDRPPVKFEKVTEHEHNHTSKKAPESQRVKTEAAENNVGHISSKRSSNSSHKHERRDKHKSSKPSKDRHSASNHSADLPPASIKVMIRKDIIPSLKASQKPPAVKPESPKPSLKMRLPKPPGMVTPEPAPKPAKPSTPALPKLVITKDKSGSGSYSTSHKNESSRKRSHSSTVPADQHYKNSHEPPPSKYQKANHSSHQKEPHKSSRHRESQRADSKPTFHQPNFQNYPTLPPPPFPTFGSYVMQQPKLNNVPLQPPLPPEMPHLPQPPPPLPPPE